MTWGITTAVLVGVVLGIVVGVIGLLLFIGYAIARR